MIELRNILKTFNNGTASETKAIDNLTLFLHTAEHRQFI